MRDVTKKLLALEAKILKLIDPAPERRPDCSRSIRRSLGFLSCVTQGPDLPGRRAQRGLLRDVIRGVRIIQRARVGGAIISAPGSSGMSYADFARHDRVWWWSLTQMRKECEVMLKDEALVGPAKSPKRGGKANHLKDAAVHFAYRLLECFGNKPPAVTDGGAWHLLARELYSSHGGRGDVFPALRAYTRNPWHGDNFPCLPPGVPLPEPGNLWWADDGSSGEFEWGWDGDGELVAVCPE